MKLKEPCHISFLLQVPIHTFICYWYPSVAKIVWKVMYIKPTTATRLATSSLFIGYDMGCHFILSFIKRVQEMCYVASLWRDIYWPSLMKPFMK